MFDDVTSQPDPKKALVQLQWHLWTSKRCNFSTRDNFENQFHVYIDHIHKWRLFNFCSVNVQISLPILTLEQEFLSI